MSGHQSAVGWGDVGVSEVPLVVFSQSAVSQLPGTSQQSASQPFSSGQWWGGWQGSGAGFVQSVSQSAVSQSAVG